MKFVEIQLVGNPRVGNRAWDARSAMPLYVGALPQGYQRRLVE